MKKIIYLVTLVVISSLILTSCKSDDPDPVVEEVVPFTLKIDEEEVVENTILVKTYNVVGADGELGFNITNNTNAAIDLKITVVSVEGNGDGMQLCFKTCSANINVDDTEIKTIEAGHTTTNVETHIFNGQVGNRDFSCTIKINQVDGNGSDIVSGKSVSFTYKYVAP